jgi:hypothetical protein
MEFCTIFPNPEIIDKGIISETFLSLRITQFQDACSYVHHLPYGYNSTREDILILFKEGFGSCTTKHAVIATLAKELSLPTHKFVGIYAMDEALVTGATRILEKYSIPYLPMHHCFLQYQAHMVDLTQGNQNGKNHPLDTFLYTEKVTPNISEKDEYFLYKKAVENNILKREEMHGVSLRTILLARAEGIALLRAKIAPQFLAKQ